MHVLQPIIKKIETLILDAFKFSFDLNENKELVIAYNGNGTAKLVIEPDQVCLSFLSRLFNHPNKITGTVSDHAPEAFKKPSEYIKKEPAALVSEKPYQKTKNMFYFNRHTGKLLDRENIDLSADGTTIATEILCPYLPDYFILDRGKYGGPCIVYKGYLVGGMPKTDKKDKIAAFIELCTEKAGQLEDLLETAYRKLVNAADQIEQAEKSETEKGTRKKSKIPAIIEQMMNQDPETYFSWAPEDITERDHGGVMFSVDGMEYQGIITLKETAPGTWSITYHETGELQENVKSTDLLLRIDRTIENPGKVEAYSSKVSAWLHKVIK